MHEGDDWPEREREQEWHFEGGRERETWEVANNGRGGRSLMGRRAVGALDDDDEVEERMKPFLGRRRAWRDGIQWCTQVWEA